jgi:hypothetical protein
MMRMALKSLMAGWVVLLGACFQDEERGGSGGPSPSTLPTGPTCDNRTTIPCVDCYTANPEHLACYDAFTHEVLPVFKKYCLGCHSAGGIGEFSTGGIDSGLNFEPDMAFQRLLMPAFGDSGATRRVVPGSPEASAVYNKIVSDIKTVWFGSPMPQGNPLIKIDSAGVDAIRKWIVGGAKPPNSLSAAR